MEHDQRWVDQIRSHVCFACPNALDPCMIEVCVAGISAVLEPSTAASATTEFAGFLDNAALGTYFTDWTTRTCSSRGPTHHYK